jgi:hypothetical protein
LVDRLYNHVQRPFVDLFTILRSFLETLSTVDTTSQLKLYTAIHSLKHVTKY